jgi:transposase
MQVVYPRWCGLDIHQQTVVACVLLTAADGRGPSVRPHLGGHDRPICWRWATGCSSMRCRPWRWRASGCCGGPYSMYWSREGRTLRLVNAQHVKAWPGAQKTRRQGSCVAGRPGSRHGLLRAALSPPTTDPGVARSHAISRDLTRYRKSLVALRTQEINRIHMGLETANP